MDLVLIPAYEPDEQLVILARRLTQAGLQVLVVDDGSGRDYREIFARTGEYATVITLPQNSGKGAALKAGMAYIREKLPQCKHFITCDADGQHRVEDVLRVRDQLHKGDKFVLTVRQFRKDMPLRSKVGNSLSRFVYALLANRYLSDNQSGLRGFSAEQIDWLVKVERDKYDYEMNVLYYAAKKNIRIATVPIEAIYIGNNESSHFQPIADTVRIYRSLLKLALGTWVGLIVSEVLVAVLSLTLGYRHLILTMPSVAAFSYLVNIIISRHVCFRNTPCHDYLTALVYTVLSYVFYTLMCLLIMYALPGTPLFLAFNLVYLVCVPLRYLLHKAIFVAGRPADT